MITTAFFNLEDEQVTFKMGRARFYPPSRLALTIENAKGTIELIMIKQQAEEMVAAINTFLDDAVIAVNSQMRRE